MKNFFKTHTSYVIGVICAVIILFTYSPLESGRENIARLMEKALEKTITDDYHKRKDKKMRHQSKALERKITRTTVTGEEGTEIIEFKDSIEEYLAMQLVEQYMLAQKNSLNPDTFNLLFQKRLGELGVSFPTGICYRYKGQTQYSPQDTTYRAKAITSPFIPLDIKKTAQVQAWVYCNQMDLLQYSNPKEFIYVVTGLITLAAMLFLSKRKNKTKPVPAFPDNLIRIDEKLEKVYINGKECVITHTGYLILVLLIREQNHFATRQQIALMIWPEEKDCIDSALLNNRIDGHINSLRKALAEFDGFLLETVKGKGYRLYIPAFQASHI